MRKKFSIFTFIIALSAFLFGAQISSLADVDYSEQISQPSQTSDNSITGEKEYKKVYSDILTDFYYTGIIGNVDEFYYYSDVNTYTSIDDSILDFYYFTLADITGDGQSKIILCNRSWNWSDNSVLQYMYVYKIINSNPVQIYFSKSNSPYLFLDNNFIIQDYTGGNIDNVDVYCYDTSVYNFEVLDEQKDSEKIAAAKEALRNNKIKFSSDSMTYLLNPENISKEVNSMAVTNINISNNAFKADTVPEVYTDYKKLYNDILKDFRDGSSKFKLADITGDNQAELIIKVKPKGMNFYGIYAIYGIVNGKAHLIGFATNDGGDFLIFNDNSVLSVDFTESGTYGSEFHYYTYNENISRFIIQKEGRYRTGDRDYLKELIKKPVKLRDLDIDTDITGENIESALK